MRALLAGLLTLAISSSALAQLGGEVESIGFEWMYRPNCWTPMLLRVSAEQSGTYQIKIVQEDLDRDRVEFVQRISLTGRDDGGTQQRFWVYFVPQPTRGGLMDVTRGGTLRELQQQLKVFLCDSRGRELAPVRVGSTVTNIDNRPGGPYATLRGNRFIVVVSEAGAGAWSDYQRAIGSLEDHIVARVRPTDLPEDVRGYEAVNAVVWLQAPVPDPLKASDEKRYRALTEWIREGGRLVVTQPPQRDALEGFASILPVRVREVVQREDPEPLPTLARAQNLAARNAWASARGPFMVGKAEARQDAIVSAAMTWDEGETTPYIVRGGYGAGSVTWVAQDLSDPGLTARPRPGWPNIWDRVLDWKNDTMMVDEVRDDRRRLYAESVATDMGASLHGMMELQAKSRALVGIAIAFFLAYWAVAGPGLYAMLAAKAKTQLSWFAFGASAIAATFLTVLVVKGVLRGDPEMAHVTVVRWCGDGPPVAWSHFGLYVPQDGLREVALREASHEHVSYVTAFPQHPAHVQTEVEFPAQQAYQIPLREAGATDQVVLQVPYRSTLKKLQAKWVGEVRGITGSAELVSRPARNELEGKLVNATGNRLKNLYLVYHDPKSVGGPDDHILYLRSWPPGQTLDLWAEFFSERLKFISTETTSMGDRPENADKLQGTMGSGRDVGWSGYWYSSPLRRTSFGHSVWDRDDPRTRRSYPMLSLWSRLPPMVRLDREERVELLHRGSRHLDVGSALSAGRLVILAEVDDLQPIPVPLYVDGKRVEGAGTVFYQFILPLTRTTQIETPNPDTQEDQPESNVEAVSWLR